MSGDVPVFDARDKRAQALDRRDANLREELRLRRVHLTGRSHHGLQTMHEFARVLRFELLGPSGTDSETLPHTLPGDKRLLLAIRILPLSASIHI